MWCSWLVGPRLINLGEQGLSKLLSRLFDRPDTGIENLETSKHVETIDVDQKSSQVVTTTSAVASDLGRELFDISLSSDQRLAGII